MDHIPRRRTPTVWIGGVPVGSEHPVVLQSMTDTDTADAEATARQVVELAAAGSELVRVTVNTVAAARAIPEIRDRIADEKPFRHVGVHGGVSREEMQVPLVVVPAS